ncbi:hypothetical protein [Pseudomonas sp. S35]|uniref:hypothetical protein n=1 Tax=Pseudomonas sp. S35 TaxID=1573719 RepID=UPI0013588E9E|nr:hypothetical protein [Pseudomonas sp. S35]
MILIQQKEGPSHPRDEATHRMVSVAINPSLAPSSLAAHQSSQVRGTRMLIDRDLQAEHRGEYIALQVRQLACLVSLFRRKATNP